MGLFDKVMNVISGASPLLGSVISGVSGLVGSSNAADAQREANEMNYKMFQEQLGFNREMFDKTNEYNAPVNQRKRYEEAGLNPYVLMGSDSGTATAQTAPSPNPAQPADALGRGLQQVGADFGRSVAQAPLLYQQIMSAKEATKASQIENAYRSSRLTNDLVEQLTRIDKLRSEAGLADDTRRVLDLQSQELVEQLARLREYNKYVSRSARADVERAEYEAQSVYLRNEYQRMFNRVFPKLTSAQLTSLSAQASAAYASAIASQASANLSNEQARRIAIQCIGDTIENGIKSNQYELSAFGLNQAELDSMRKRGVLEHRENSEFFREFDDAINWIVDSSIGRIFK